MRPADNIEKQIKKLDVEPSTQMYAQTLKDTLEAHKKSTKTHSAAQKPNIWRINMKSRITKFAAAAVIIVGVIIGINQFGGSIDIATVALAEMNEAMKKMPWMHLIFNQEHQSGDNNMTDQWYSFQSQIFAARYPNGKVAYADGISHKLYNYNPDTQIVNIKYQPEDIYVQGKPLKETTPINFFGGWIDFAEQQGTVTRSVRRQNGKDFDILELQVPYEGYSDHPLIVRFVSDIETHLPIAWEVGGHDSDGKKKMVTAARIEYPTKGPLSIYDLGVPHDAKITSDLPAADYMEVWEKYRSYINKVPKRYITIITEEYTDSRSDVVRFFYRDNKQYSTHNYFQFPGLRKGKPKITINDLDLSFDALMKWAENSNNYDSASRSVGKFRNDPPRTCSLEQKGWRWIGAKGKIIQDSYAIENNLICIERLQQGIIHDDGRVTLPGRFLFYLNPERDYTCQRQVTEWRPGAEWQNDKSWLDDIDPEKIGAGSITVTDITNYMRSPTGQWYPKVLKTMSSGRHEDYARKPFKLKYTETIYFQANPDFPEGIFDPENLPR